MLNISSISAGVGDSWSTSTKKPMFSAASMICRPISVRRVAKSCSEILGIFRGFIVEAGGSEMAIPI